MREEKEACFLDNKMPNRVLVDNAFSSSCLTKITLFLGHIDNKISRGVQKLWLFMYQTGFIL